MAIIIDTYNCVYAGAAMGGAMADLSVRTLCRWIVASLRREKTTLVLDGRPKPHEPSENEFPDINIVYSGAGISADRVIEQMAERSGRREKLTIVTNDRALGASVRHLGAKVVPCETYLKKMMGSRGARSIAKDRTDKAKSAGTTSPGETQAWLEEFGVVDVPSTNDKPTRQDQPIDGLNIEDLLGPRGG